MPGPLFSFTSDQGWIRSRVGIGPVRIPTVLLVGGAAYAGLILFRMFSARNTEADGTTEDEFDRPSNGPCAKIEDQFETPLGCGTVGAIGYEKSGIGKTRARQIQLRELAPYPGFYLQSAPTNAYAAFLRMRQAAMNEAGLRMQLNSAFRTMGKQRELYQRYIKRGKPVAAYPGTSPHQMGLAVDIQTNGGTLPIYKWLVGNSQRFGFYRTVASEPWHYHYFVDRDPFLKR